MRCRFYKREKGEVRKNLCMAEMAVMGVEGDTYTPSSDEVFDYCLSEDGFKNCPRFQWVEREKDKETIKRTF